MSTHRVTRTWWPKGAWMKLISNEALGELMQKQQVSYGELARSAGVTKGFISHLVKGRRASCTPLVGYRIAERLGVPAAMIWQPCVPPASSQNANQNRKAA